MVDSEQQVPVAADIYLIHDGTLDLQRFHDIAAGRNLIGLHWEQRDTAPARARVLLYLGDAPIRELVPLAVEKQWEIGLLVHPEANKATRALGVKGGLEQLLRHYLQADTIEADVLLCNDQVVLSSVVIGEVPALKPHDAARPPTRSVSPIAACP